MTVTLLGFDTFPCRPKRCDGESLVGYVYRFLSRNGHRTAIGGYYEVVRRIYARDLEVSEVVLSALACAIGEPEYFRTSFWRERAYLFKERFYRRSTRFPVLRSQRLWFCCTCMKGHPVHQEYWTFPLARTCPIHGEWLISVCSVCAEPLYWGGLNREWCCSSGHTVYAGVSSRGALRSVMRDQLFSQHIHFLIPCVAPYFAKYSGQVAIHEQYVAYLASLAKIAPTTAKSVVALDWGLEGYVAVDLNQDEKPYIAHRKHTVGAAPPLTYLFLRWLYLWRVAMQPAGSRIPEYVSTLTYTVIPRTSGRVSPRIRKNGTEWELGRSGQLISSLGHLLIHIQSQVPLSIGISALQQFDQWWLRAVTEAHQAGFISAVGINSLGKDSEEEANAAVDHEVCLASVLDLLVFAACMDFGVSDLKEFWSGIYLPQQLPGKTCQRPYKRLVAHLMNSRLLEVQQWEALLKVSLRAQRGSLYEYFR